MDIQIQISAQALEQGLTEVMGEAISRGISSYEIRQRVTEIVKQQIEAAQLPALLHAELAQRLQAQAGDIVRQVADEVIPALRVAFAQAFRSALVAMVYGLQRGRPAYMTEDERRRWCEIRRELFPDSPNGDGDDCR